MAVIPLSKEPKADSSKLQIIGHPIRWKMYSSQMNPTQRFSQIKN